MTRHNGLLVAILLLALLLRFWDLGRPPMGADESLHYLPEMQQIHQLPFEQQRIHPTDLYHATSPNPIGHPLFAVQVVNVAIRLLGPTPAVARGVMALSGVLLVLVAYWLGRDLFSAGHGLLAAAVAALLPQAVRYQRTLYLDPIYSLLTAAFVLALYRAMQRRSPGRAIGAGVLLGLAAATKTAGPLLLLLAAAYALFVWWSARRPAAPSPASRKKARRHPTRGPWPPWLLAPAGLLALLTAAALLVFLMFVSPGPYLQAIRQPVDTAYQNATAAFYLRHLWQQRAWLGGVALYLWTPPVLLAAAGGLLVLIRRGRQARPADALLLLWLLTTGPLLFLHLAGLSGEHGYLSFVAPLALLAAVGLLALPPRWQLPAVALVLLAMLPASILYGLRLLPTPYRSYLNNVDAPPAP